jgi:hypothetical protein
MTSSGAGDHGTLLELQHSLNNAWRNRHTPLQWHVELLQNNVIREAGDKIVSELLSNIFLDHLPSGTIPNPFLLKYLHHALSTRLISAVIFFSQLHQRILNTTALIQQQEQEGRAEIASLFDRTALFAEYVRLINVFAPEICTILNITHTEFSTNNAINEQSILDASQTLVKCCLVLIHYLNYQYFHLHQQLTRQSQQLLQQTTEGDAMQESESLPSITVISDDTMSTIDSAQSVLTLLLSNEKTRLLINFCEHIDFSLWKTFQESSTSVFLNPLNAQYIPSQLHHCTSSLFNRRDTQFTGSEFLLRQPSHFQQAHHTQTQEQFNLSMFIINELTTCDLQRTNLEATFNQLEKIRHVLDLNPSRFIFELLYATMTSIQAAKGFTNTTFGNILSDHIRTFETRRMALYKSFLLAKIPALLQKWLAGIEAPTTVLEPIIKQLNYFPSIFILLQPAPPQEQPIDGLTDGTMAEVPQVAQTDLLVELMLVLLRMGMLDEANIKRDMPQFIGLRGEEYENVSLLSVYPQYPIPPVLLTPQEKEQMGEGATEDNFEDDTAILQSIESNHAAQVMMLYRFLEGIWPTTEDGLAAITPHARSMSFLALLSRNPSILDLFHLHGLIPALISRNLRMVVQILQNFSSRAIDSDQDDHSDFSVALTVLYLIVERFEVIQYREGKKVFESLLESAYALYRNTMNFLGNGELPQTSDMDRLMNWFRQWFYDAVPGERARDGDDDGMGGDGDKLLAALLTAQNKREQQPTSDGMIPEAEPFDENLLALKKEMSPVRILELSHYVAQQCLYVVAANRCKPLTVFSMLALFCEHFGSYVELGISLSLRTCLHHVFFTTQYPLHILRLMEELKDCLSKQQHRPGKTMGTDYNIGSVMLHNIIKRHVNFVNQNHYDITRNPSVLDYEKMQKFMKDEYTIVRNPALHPTVQWQSTMCQTPPIDSYQGNVLIPMVTNTNSSSASSCTVPATSITMSCAPQSTSYGTLLRTHLDSLVREDYDLGRTDAIVFIRQFFGTFGLDHLTSAVLQHLYHSCGGSLQLLRNQQQGQQQTSSHPSSHFKHHQAAYTRAAMRMADAAAMAFYCAVDRESIDAILQIHLGRFISHYIGSDTSGSVSTRVLLAKATAQFTVLLLSVSSSYKANLVPILALIRKTIENNSNKKTGERTIRLDDVDATTIYLIYLTEKLVSAPEIMQELFIGEEGGQLMMKWAKLLKQKFGKDKIAVELFDLKSSTSRQLALSVVLSAEEKRQTRNNNLLNLLK